MPCIEEDLYYDEVIQFKNFSQINGSAIGFPGLIITIVSVQIDTVTNLPPGISYQCNSPNCYYTTGENGCVRIYGTTSAPPGVYNLGFYATLMVDIGFGPFPYPADSQLLANNGLGYVLTIVNQGGDCPNHYTGQLYFNASIPDPSYCEGDTVPFHTLTSAGTPPYTYSWSPGNNLSSPATADPLLFPTNPGTYRVTVMDDVGLTATDSVVVEYQSSPAIIITSDTTICAGDSVQLNASGGISYSWMPATALSSTDIANPLAFPSQTTSYTVTVSNGSCSGAADVTVAVDDVRPEASFIPIESNFTVLFNNTSTGATGYLWDFGDGTTSTERSPNHQYPQRTVYDVTLIVTNNCGFSDTASAQVDLTVGMSGNEVDDRIEVYPNPGSGMLSLKVNGMNGRPVSCEIISTCGKVVVRKTYHEQKNAIIPLDLSDYPKGIYFLKVNTDDVSTFRKIIFQ